MAPLSTPSSAPVVEGVKLLWQTAQGPIWIETHASAATIGALQVDAGIGIFSHYGEHSREQQKEVLMRVAAMPDGNAVIAYSPAGSIVGYICLTAPSAEDRWGGAGFEFVYEFGLLEVSRHWRGIGLADKLMEIAFAEDALEDKIVVSNSYAWHWDTAESGLSKWQYRGMLEHLLARHGFQALDTDEENIRFDAANLLTARFGKRADPDQIARFQHTLFYHRQT